MDDIRSMVQTRIASGNFSFARKYLTILLLMICLIVLSVFWGFGYKAGLLIEQQLHYQGRAFLQEIINTREWAAAYGGVYVEMRPGMRVNQYLMKVPGIKPVITAADGTRYTLKNPALITREISEMHSKKGLFHFHITSINPTNPDNRPDSFERAAFKVFEQGGEEHYAYEQKENGSFYRYMVPLRTEKSCLVCHLGERYREGEVLGGISVTIPATSMLKELRQNRFTLAVSAFAIVVLVYVIIRFISEVLVERLEIAERKLVEMATTDYLTGLLNRRELFRLLATEVSRADRCHEPLSLVLIDIDFFKKINDTYGHSAGDLALKAFSRTLQESVRDYDILCRYGGEEFLIVAPKTSADMAVKLVERLRTSPLEVEIATEGGATSIRIKFSAGVAERLPGEEVDMAISRADAALYRAKEAGRDRIELAATSHEAHLRDGAATHQTLGEAVASAATAGALQS